MGILNTSLLLKSFTFTISLWFPTTFCCQFSPRMLFLPFYYSFLVIQHFYSYGISIDFPEDIIDRNTSIIFVLLFKRLILSEDLELTCRIFLFSSYPQMLLLLVTYFEQNGSIYMQEHQ